MSYQVKTAVYEGPLDLLLQLITSHQVEITELSLSDLVTEYLSYLDVMEELDLEIASEFLLIAATLVQLKARHLLPEDVDIDLDEELALAEERDLLLSRLLACLTFKDVGAVLAHRMESSERYLGRTAGLDSDIKPAPPELKLSIGIEEFARIAARVERRQADIELDHFELDLPSVDDAIADLRSRIVEAAETDFEALTAHLDRPIEVVAYFLALLELARWGLVGVSQEHRDDMIRIEARPEVDDITKHSEWSDRGDPGTS